MDKPLPKDPELTPYEKMRELALRVMAVPKSELDRREAEYQTKRAAVRKARK